MNRPCGCSDTHLHQRQPPHRCFDCTKCVVGKVRKLTDPRQTVMHRKGQGLVVAKNKKLVRP